MHCSKMTYCGLLLLLPVLLLGQNWQSDFDTALSKAKTEDKPLILVFSGSDWCAPCIKLEHDIWTSEEFIAYADKNYVLYRADFPRKKRNRLPAALATVNAELAEKFNPNGHFPLVVLMDGNEHTYGQMGYDKKSVKAYISKMNAYLQ
ncbi:thioredoxin family protein [uncultured Croceitalea sp.]|uniref:thioredoxin family protein n=1 Tax=uncultured Croceitalea sp. TaxID=1798908 RepID=UPI0033058B6D